MMTSMWGSWLSWRMAWQMPPAASAPCTGVGASTTWARGQRRPVTLQMSWKTAPVGEGTIPGRSDQPLGLQLLLEPLELGLPGADTRRLHEVHHQLQVAAGLVEGDVAV